MLKKLKIITMNGKKTLVTKYFAEIPDIRIFKFLTTNFVMLSYSFCLVSCNYGGFSGSDTATNLVSTSSQYKDDGLTMVFDSSFSLPNVTATGNFKILQGSLDTDRFIVHNDQASGSLAIDKVGASGVPTRIMSNISSGPANEIKAVLSSSATGDRVIYVLYRSGSTQNFFINAIDVDSVSNQPLGVGHYGYSFQAQSPDSVGNKADLVIGENGALYIAYIDQNNYPHVDTYNAEKNYFVAISGRKYYEGVKTITDAKEIRIAVSPVDDLPVILVSTDNPRRPLFLERFSLLSPSDYANVISNDSGINYASKGDWVAYYDVTPGLLVDKKVIDINFAFDKNANVVIAYTSKEDLNGHLIRLHNTNKIYNKSMPVPTSYEPQDLSPNGSISQGGFSKNDLIIDSYGTNYFFSFSSMNPASGYPTGTVFILRYNVKNNSWSMVPEYSYYNSTSTTQPKFSDLVFNPLTAVVSLAIQNPNANNLLLEEARFYPISSSAGSNSNGSSLVQINSTNTTETNESPAIRKVFYTNSNFDGNLVAAATQKGLGNFTGAYAGYAAADALCANDANNPAGIGKGKWHALLYKNPSLADNFATADYYVNNNGEPVSANYLLSNSPSNVAWMNSGGQTLTSYDSNTNLSTYWTGFYDYSSTKSQQGPFPFSAGQNSCNPGPSGVIGFVDSMLTSLADPNFMVNGVFSPASCLYGAAPVHNYQEGAHTVAYKDDPYLFSCNGWTSNSSTWGGVYGDDSKSDVSTVEADAGASASIVVFNQQSALNKANATCPSTGNVSGFQKFLVENGTAFALSGIGLVPAIAAGAFASTKYTSKLSEAVTQSKKLLAMQLDKDTKELIAFRKRIMDLQSIELNAYGNFAKIDEKSLLSYGITSLRSRSIDFTQSRAGGTSNLRAISSALKNINRRIEANFARIAQLNNGDVPAQSISLSGALSGDGVVEYTNNVDKLSTLLEDMENNPSAITPSAQANAESLLKKIVDAQRDINPQVLLVSNARTDLDKLNRILKSQNITLKSLQDSLVNKNDKKGTLELVRKNAIENFKSLEERLKVRTTNLNDLKSIQEAYIARTKLADNEGEKLMDLALAQDELAELKAEKVLLLAEEDSLKLFLGKTQSLAAEVDQATFGSQFGLDSRFTDASQRYTETVAKLEEIKPKVTAAETKVTSVNSAIADLKNQIKAQNEIIDDLPMPTDQHLLGELKKVKELEDQVDSARILKVKAEEDITTIRREISRLNRDISTKNSEIANLSSKQAEAERSLDSITDRARVELETPEIGSIVTADQEIETLADAAREAAEKSAASPSDSALADAAEKAVNAFNQKAVPAATRDAQLALSNSVKAATDGGMLMSAITGVSTVLDLAVLGLSIYIAVIQNEAADASIPSSCVKSQSGSGGVSVQAMNDYLGDTDFSDWIQNHNSDNTANSNEWHVEAVQFVPGQPVPPLPADIQPTKSNILAFPQGGVHFVYQNQVDGAICDLPQTIPGWSNSSPNPQCPASRQYSQDSAKGYTSKNLLIPIMASCSTAKPLLCVGPY